MEVRSTGGAGLGKGDKLGWGPVASAMTMSITVTITYEEGRPSLREGYRSMVLTGHWSGMGERRVLEVCC